MKKIFKIAGIVLVSLLSLLFIALLLTRFVFREKAISHLAQLQKQQRVELLREAAPYAADTTQYRFTYQQNTARAREIREYFRLDTLLHREASTWDNTLWLATFVAQQIPHGNHRAQPPTRDALGIWKFHCDSVPALNCRMHSLLLHELLLSAGITNRYVTCFPQDPEDPDCHVVNQVWLPELQKWAMIDSDGCSYVTDTKGTPLSLDEMRLHTINGAAMEVKNLEGCTPHSDYLSYWAKNLYWFACTEQTGYGCETPPNNGRTIYLVPTHFTGFRLWEPYAVTSDKERFWAAPTL